MTAMYFVDDHPSPAGRHPLAPGASPDAIRSHLLPADRDTFDQALAQATEDLRATLDLTGLFRTLEHWRRIAIVQGDRQGFERVARRVAERNTGQAPAPGEPLDSIRVKAGM